MSYRVTSNHITSISHTSQHITPISRHIIFVSHQIEPHYHITSLSYKITPYYIHVTYITVHHTHITSTSRYISLCHTTFQIALTLCSHHVQRTHLTPTSCHIIFVLYHTISHTHNAHHRYITPKYHRHHQQDMT